MPEISMSGYSVYSKVADNATKAFIGELIGAAVVYWLAGAWRLGGILFFAIFVVFTLQDSFQVAVLLFPGDTTQGPADDQEFSLWWRRAKYVRVVSLLISVGLLWFLYRRLW